MSVEDAAPGTLGSFTTIYDQNFLLVPPHLMLMSVVYSLLKKNKIESQVCLQSKVAKWASALNVFVFLLRKSSRLQREEKASNGKQQAGKDLHCYVLHGTHTHFFSLTVFGTINVNMFSTGTSDVPDEVEGSSTPKRSRFDLQRRDVEEEEEEDRSVRRSSRITRYKLDSRNQSALYDRLITKWVRFAKRDCRQKIDFY